ncbi:phosphotransferase [Streptomyces sp. N2-109]|uniref:Phosphotransferase n=1 Tax=Streptomyces gossypii TaxID=2883101 RepID=A0ABT2K576_9ACTN|nr:phosphotransferase [Streptomyces gossypii]MCT2594654.1 phosphotransferase [Streptomyces gossypii]
MKDRPPDLDEHELRRELRVWEIEPVTLTYVPVGFGDHHWRAMDALGREWFLTVADLAHKEYCGDTPESALQGLRHAMDTAAALREEAFGRPGLDFVVAPLRTVDGETVRPLGPGARYGLSVFPYVEATPGSFDDQLAPEERAPLIDLLATLHTTAPPASAPVLSPELTSRLMLEEALREWEEQPGGPGARGEAKAVAESPAQGGDEGPYAEPARALVAKHAAGLRQRLDEFDRLVTELSRSGAELVVTHGEPHPGNLLWRGDRCLLADWDTAGLAAPERDLWHIAPLSEDLARYQAATGRTPDPSALALYRLRWDLEDLTVYLGWFRAPHVPTQDMAQGWAGLTEIMSRLA